METKHNKIASESDGKHPKMKKNSLTWQKSLRDSNPILQQSSTPVGVPAGKTRNSAIAEGPRDASSQLKSCQLTRNSAETTCTTSPEQIEVIKLVG